MNNDDKQEVLDLIDSEGFDYCFIHKTQFQNIKDDKFHQLRLAYIEAHNNLLEYLEE